MRVAGILPSDAPDPRAGWAERLKLMPIQVMGLAPQPSLEDTDSVGVTYGQDDRGYNEMTASITYTLWRNPDDRSDPVNLADLDEKTRRSIEEVPPWPRPPWLIKYVERLRYPQLEEAVRTTWHRDPSERSSVRSLLADHVNHILMNQYRQELWPGSNPWDQHAPTVTGRMVNSQARTVINGVDVPGAEIDTDPFVYGIGAQLAGRGVVTAVLPRTDSSTSKSNSRPGPNGSIPNTATPSLTPPPRGNLVRKPMAKRTNVETTSNTEACESRRFAS